MRQIEKGKRHLKKSEQKDNSGAAKNFQINVSLDLAFLDAATERERNCHTDDKQKKRKNHIRRRPAVPRSVFRRGVNCRPISGVVDQNHTGDSYAAKNIERN